MKIKNTLVIEDAELDRYIIDYNMKRLNCFEKVSFTKTAIDALVELEELGDDNFPELILLDLNLPIMSGLEFLQEFKKLPWQKIQDCKIVVYSSINYAKDIETIQMDPHVLQFMSKPLDKDKLEGLTRLVLQS